MLVYLCIQVNSSLRSQTPTKRSAPSPGTHIQGVEREALETPELGDTLFAESNSLLKMAPLPVISLAAGIRCVFTYLHICASHVHHIRGMHTACQQINANVHTAGDLC